MVSIGAALTAMPDFMGQQNEDPASEPMPLHPISPVIFSSLTGENVAPSGSLNAYIINRNKRQTQTDSIK